MEKGIYIFLGRKTGGVVAKNILLALTATIVIVGGILYFAGKRSQPALVEIGVPEYPRAVASVDSFSVRLSAEESAGVAKAVVYKTDDPPEKVITFYKEKLGGKTQVLERNQDGNSSAVIRTVVNGRSTFIMISTNEGAKKTEIVIGTLVSSPTQ